MWNIINKNKKYLKYIVIILLIGLLFSFLYYHFLNSSIKSNINNTLLHYNNFRYNGILKDLIISSVLLISSFFIIGIPLSLFYLFYESFSIGFLINIFYASFGIKGIIYSIIYIFVNKLLNFILMVFFVKRTINIGRYIIGLLVYKNDDDIKKKLILNFKNCLKIIVITFINNIILFFLSPIIFEWLFKMLK